MISGVSSGVLDEAMVRRGQSDGPVAWLKTGPFLGLPPVAVHFKGLFFLGSSLRLARFWPHFSYEQLFGRLFKRLMI